MSNKQNVDNNKEPTYDGHRTLYYNPGLASDKRQPIYYVNGMNVTSEKHKKHAQRLSELVNVKVLGIYNEKGYQFRPDLEFALCICLKCIGEINPLKIVNLYNDFTKDVIQSIWDWLLLAINSYEPGAASNVTRKAMQTLLSMSNREWLAKTILNYNPCIVSLMDLLKPMIMNGKPIHIIAHSQGNLITSNALGALSFCTEQVRRNDKKITVYAVASPAWTWPKGVNVRYYTHLNDFVPLFALGKSLRGVSIKWPQKAHEFDTYLDTFKFRIISDIRSDLGISGPI